MKNFTFILVLIFLGLSNATGVAQGGWSLQTNPTSEEGESMQFVSATEGWIGLNSNKLLHTTNAGLTWNIVTPTDDSIGGMDAPGSRISFVDASTGWVMKSFADTNGNFLGTNLYKTLNGGLTWNRTGLSTAAGDAGIQVQFVDVNNGWLLIYNMDTGTPTFMKTTDGGASWTPTNGAGIFYYVNATTGYAFSAGPSMLPPYTIFKTIDGGASWTSQYVDNTAGELNAIHFTDANNGWIVGNNGKIFNTTDGSTWTQITNSGYNSNYSHNAVSFINNTTGWIGSQNNTNGSHFTLSTTDGGSTWSTQELPFYYRVYSMDFWDANNGWAASDYGSIAKYSAYTGTYSNATLNGPWFGYLNPLDPYNEQFGYLVFDGIGHIVDGSQFPSQTTGTYSVNPDGSFTAALINGLETVTFIGHLSSPTEAVGSAMGMTFNFHKIANPGALKDKIAGTLTTTGGCGQRDVTFNIDSNGNIISATGLIGPVSGRVYTDLGVFLGHIKTGEPTNGWHLFSIKGYYNSNENKLTGQIEFDYTTCNAGSEALLVRSDNTPNVYPSVGIVGDATSGWDTDIAMSTSDGITYKITSYTFKNGGAKFRQDNTWAINWGSNNFPSGTGTQDGPNIPVIAGTYDVIFNRNTGAYNFTNPLGIKENLLHKYLTIYPNPNNGTFYFSLKDTNSKIKVEIFNLTGQKVYEASNLEKQTMNEINFIPQSNGVYFIKINDGETSYTEKIVVQ